MYGIQKKWYNRAHRMGGFGVGGSGSLTLLSNLAAYYKLDEASGNAIDSLGLHNGTPVGVTQNVAGKINTCYTFNGTSGGILIGNVSTSSVFTYAAWVQTSAIATNQGIVAPNGGNNAPYFRIATTGQLQLFQANTAVVGNSIGSIVNGVFTHVAVTYDVLGNYAFYINGALSGSGNNLLAFVFFPFIIGDLNNFTDWFTGQIDEIGLWDRVLTATEIGLLYNGGAGKSYPF